jgi:thiol-disulfide isomerase/thioredoxin
MVKICKAVILNLKRIHMKSVIFMLFFLSAIIVSNGQNLTVGDWVPSSLPLAKKTLGDYRGKVVIIDFFATWSAAAISALPTLDYFGKRYADDVQVILVSSQNTGDTWEGVAKFFSSKYVTEDGVPFDIVVNDSIISSYFNYSVVPHYVWIGSNGQILAITGSDQLTKRNIETAIQYGVLNLPIKRDSVE